MRNSVSAASSQPSELLVISILHIFNDVHDNYGPGLLCFITSIGNAAQLKCKIDHSCREHVPVLRPESVLPKKGVMAAQFPNPRGDQVILVQICNQIIQKVCKYLAMCFDPVVIIAVRIFRVSKPENITDLRGQKESFPEYRSPRFQGAV